MKKLIVLLTFIFFTNLISQTLNMQMIPNEKKQFGLSFDKAFYDSNIEYSAFSGVYQLYFNVPISSKLNLFANIPFIYSSYSLNYGFGVFENDDNGFENIFIGLQTKPSSEALKNQKISVITFGLFLPTANEKISGIYENYYDFLKYVPNSWGLYFNYAFHKLANEGFTYGLEVGPNIMLPSKDNYNEAEIFLHYGGSLNYQVEKFQISAELLGMVIITEDPNDFVDRFVHMLNIGAIWKGGLVIPKIYYKIYLRDEIRRNINGVLGLGINISID